MRMTCRVLLGLLAARLAAASFTQRWAPAAEYANLHEGNATDWLHKVDAELTRSLAYFDRPASAEALVAELFAKQEAVFVLDGRVFMHKSYFKRVKVGGHGVLLKESYARSKFGNCAWLHVDAASGGDGPLDKRFPTTVIAKQKGYAQPGILVPNPYWGGHQPDGLLRRWAAHSTKLAARAKNLPLSQRTAKVMWRGDCRVHGGKACAFQEGNRARLLGSSLTSTRPDLFDVRCKVNDVVYRPPKDFSCVAPSSRPALQQARRDALRHPPLTKDFVHNEDFVKWRYLLNLPGQTSGSRLLCRTLVRAVVQVSGIAPRRLARQVQHHGVPRVEGPVK